MARPNGEGNPEGNDSDAWFEELTQIASAYNYTFSADAAEWLRAHRAHIDPTDGASQAYAAKLFEAAVFAQGARVANAVGFDPTRASRDALNTLTKDDFQRGAQDITEGRRL